MRVVELTVIGNVLRRSREAKLTISGVNVDPVDREIRQIRRNDRAHIVRSEARVKKIVAAEPMVDAGVERGAELRSVRIEEKDIRFLSGRPKVGQRIQLEQVGRNVRRSPDLQRQFPPGPEPVLPQWVRCWLWDFGRLQPVGSLRK